MRELKEVKRERIHRYAERFPKATYHEGKKPWGIKADLAFPCATQNEIDKDDATNLVKQGVMAVAEGANMPTANDAIEVFKQAGTLFAPGKAANAGGVAVSGLEQAQNAQRMSWSRDEVDQRLQEIMQSIHSDCADHGRNAQGIDYVDGANIAGFVKVANAALAYGVM